ncbi:MAG: ribonuclease III [Ignavibacteriales bacterium]|nr:ribonuclease III [Ignavibacteriales bacterium]
MEVLRRFLSGLFKSRGAAKSTSEIINYSELEKILGYSIRNKDYFTEALSHRSYLQVNGKEDLPTNERLEFLGDSVLNLVVGEYLFNKHPEAEEGDLTKIRSRLVNRNALSILAREIDLPKFLLLSPSALQVSVRGMETILSDAFEAIIAAIYLDGGFHNAEKFIHRCLTTSFEKKLIKLEDENFKSQLLEQAQSVALGNPRYVTVTESGPDHDRLFTVEVFIGKNSYGVGSGKNKKAAEQDAAANALKNLLLNERRTDDESPKFDN